MATSPSEAPPQTLRVRLARTAGKHAASKRAAASPGLRDFVTLGVGFALLFGTLEGVEAAALRKVPGVQPLAKVSLDILWIAPVFHLVLNVVVAMVLGIALRLGAPVSLAIAAGVFAFLGTLAIVGSSGYIAHVASVLLALGVAVQVVRLWRRRDVLPWLRRTSLALSLFVIAAPIGLRLLDRYAEWRVERGLPTAPVSATNVLLIVLDTVRADYLSSYGYPRPTTPVLDRFAAQGVLFKKAYASSSWTFPSHASLVTGLPVSGHGATSALVNLGPVHPLLQEVFQRRGYATGAFIANNAFVIPERGFDADFQHFDVYDVRTLFARTAYGRLVKQALDSIDVLFDPYRSARAINGRFRRWVATLNSRPFFALINYMEAHEPYLARGQRPNLRLFGVDAHRTPAQNRLLAAAYERALTYLDADIGTFFAELARQPWWKNTLVVIVSDHGEAISDGSFDHGTDLVLEQIQVPLIVRLPGRVPAGVRVDAAVSLVDVPATIQELAGVSSGPRLPGQSLSRWWSASAAPDQQFETGVLTELVEPKGGGMLRSVILRDHQYIVNPAREERLYDLRRDPAQHHNLAPEPASGPMLRLMRDALARHTP